MIHIKRLNECNVHFNNFIKEEFDNKVKLSDSEYIYITYDPHSKISNPEIDLLMTIDGFSENVDIYNNIKKLKPGESFCFIVDSKKFNVYNECIIIKNPWKNSNIIKVE